MPLEAPISTTTCSSTGLSCIITAPCAFRPSYTNPLLELTPRRCDFGLLTQLRKRAGFVQLALSVAHLSREPLDGRDERFGALDVGQMAAVGHELKVSFLNASYRVSCLGFREHPVASSPHDECWHLQERETVHQHLVLTPWSYLGPERGQVGLQVTR